jgi:hypothetical protein
MNLRYAPLALLYAVWWVGLEELIQEKLKGEVQK